MEWAHGSVQGLTQINTDSLLWHDFALYGIFLAPVHPRYYSGIALNVYEIGNQKRLT